MAWCPMCKNEYRDGISVCSECGCELVVQEKLDMHKPVLYGQEEMLEGIKKYLEAQKLSDIEIRFDEQKGVHLLFVKEQDWKNAKAIAEGYMQQYEYRLSQKAMSEQSAGENADSEGGMASAKEQPSEERIYVNSADKAEENFSSAWTLLLVGGIGLIAMILCIAGVIPFHVGNPYMFYSVMGVIFVVFIVMGIFSLKSARVFAREAESENSLRDTLLKWAGENLKAESIDVGAEYSEDSEEELYFKRCELLKNKINHQFMNLDQSFLDKLIDDDIYDMVFTDKGQKQ